MWSNNKYDLSLDKKYRDTMGIDALYDNIISDESTDDDDELFDTNEVLDLNEDTDSNMGLKFQARQA